MPTIMLDDKQPLFYALHSGEADRPALILIHGAGGDRTNWPHELRRLSGFETYVLDLPGHGRSPSPSHDSIDAYADAVEAFIDALELQQVILVGHSMGGAIAQTIGLRQNEHVVGLVLIGTSARLRVGNVILDNVMDNTQVAIEFVVKYAWSKEADEATLDMSRRALEKLSPQLLYDDYIACNNFNFIGKLHAIQVPTLMIAGSEDKMTPARNGRYLANEIPNAHYVCLEGAGHYIMLEQPVQTAKTMSEFLTQFVQK